MGTYDARPRSFERLDVDPDVAVGDHVPTVTPAHPTRGRRVVCASCGREASLRGDRERIFRELAATPCVDGPSYADLVDVLISPTEFTPSLSELGIDRWYARPGRRHGEDVRRVFRHDRFQHAVYALANDDGTYTAALKASTSASADPYAEMQFPSDDPDVPATRETAVTFVTFLEATDPLSPREFETLRAHYDDARGRHRDAWLADAYERARSSFRESVGGPPESFADAFSESVPDAETALRRVVGSGGFDDPGESAFARELLGHDHGFPGFLDYVADRRAWAPPVVER